jgi:hypothetical protein
LNKRQAVRSIFGRSWRHAGLGCELRRSWRYSTGRNSVTEALSPGFEKSPVRTAFWSQNVGIPWNVDLIDGGCSSSGRRVERGRTVRTSGHRTVPSPSEDRRRRRVGTEVTQAVARAMDQCEAVNSARIRPVVDLRAEPVADRCDAILLDVFLPFDANMVRERLDGAASMARQFHEGASREALTRVFVDAELVGFEADFAVLHDDD